MIYCVSFDGIHLKVYVQNGIILKTSFSQDQNGIKRAEFQKNFEGFIHGNKETLKFSFVNVNDRLRKVYWSTMKIPYGRVASYGDVSYSVYGNKNYSRFVGYAMSVNPLPMIVPCHRVVESDRTIGGFSGSVELKLKLLELEKVKIFNGKIDKTFFANL